MQMKFEVFDFKNQLSSELFQDFYAIMESSFPKEERRTREGFLNLIGCCEQFKIYALLSEKNMVAFFTVWELSGFTFGDHFAVCSELRNKGLGADLLKEVLSQSKLPFILEAELPETEIAQRRLNFYKRNGFKENLFPYLLPPMQQGCSATPMHILSYPESLSESEFKNVKETLYKIVYNTKTAAI